MPIIDNPNFGNRAEESDGDSAVKIMIIGVGGGGSNAVDNMIEANVQVDKFVAINTDKQALKVSKAPIRCQIGVPITKGFGAGTDPEKGRLAAEHEKTKAALTQIMKDMDLIFITAGMGGGTGTGAAPVIARIAHEMGKLTIAFVTTPFKFEGARRMKNAMAGIAELRKYIDSIVVVSNERLACATGNFITQDAFKYADDILRRGVQALTDIIMNPGKINVDFADITTILKNGGDALMTVGRASGPNRATEAVKCAVSNSVLDLTVEGASSAIIQVEGGAIKMSEVTQAVKLITDLCTPDANIVVGHTIAPEYGDQLQVTIIATGFNRHGGAAQQPTPQQQRAQAIINSPPVQQEIPQQPESETERKIYDGADSPVTRSMEAAGNMAQAEQASRARPKYSVQGGYVELEDDDPSWFEIVKKGRR